MIDIFCGCFLFLIKRTSELAVEIMQEWTAHKELKLYLNVNHE